MWSWTYTGHMLVIPDGNILARGLFLAIGSCLLKQYPKAGMTTQCWIPKIPQKNPEVKRSWPNLHATSNKFQMGFHVSLSLQEYLHARLVCMQGTSAPYPEGYLNVLCRNIKKFCVILLEFPILMWHIPNISSCPYELVQRRRSCTFQWPSGEKRTLGKERVKLDGWMPELSFGHSTTKRLEQKHVIFFLHFPPLYFLIIWRKLSVCIFWLTFCKG